MSKATNGFTSLAQIERPKVLTTGQVAKMCGVAPRTASKWVDRGSFPGAYRIPGSEDRRVPVDDLVRFLTDNKMPIPMALAPPGPSALACLPRPMIAELQGEEVLAGRVLAVDNPFLAAEAAAKVYRLPLLLLDTTWINSAEDLVASIRGRHPGVAVWAIGWQDTPDSISWASVIYRRPFDVEVLSADVVAFCQPAPSVPVTSKRQRLANLKRVAAESAAAVGGAA